MNDEELNLDLDQEETLPSKNRLEKLSEKVIFTAKERDEANKAKEEESQARLKAEKERDFFRDFSQTSSKYPQATNYQDKILEKVNIGYSVEDATLAILAKEGKLQGQPQQVPIDDIAGGSAGTTINEKSNKDYFEMSVNEKREVLMDLERQGINLLERR